ncbi:MAG: hypothetical protein DI535_24790 [Citrobacter freundii]|nr:MAG: hypothetical protein DI535_24790 [Citrobacter freundii]
MPAIHFNHATSLIAVLLFLVCCRNKAKQTKPDEPPPPPISSAAQDTMTVYLVKEFPVLKDTAGFMDQLLRVSRVRVSGSPTQAKKREITYYKKIRLHGSEQSFFLVEYDWKEGPNTAYPWKAQFLLNENGRLISTFSALRWELLKDFNNEQAYLLTVTSTAKGNGSHSLYGFRGGKLENLLYSPDSMAVFTYDRHADRSVYKPYELTPVIKDENHDGMNDISFQGKILLIQGRSPEGVWYDAETINGKEMIYSTGHPFKSIPVNYIFLYDTSLGIFKPKENYRQQQDSLLN